MAGRVQVAISADGNKIDVTSRTQAARYAIDHQMTVAP